ncbi:MAG: hypothetical protein KAJ12_09765, partial [Bacteroidetes bacterium]|nr:hypothetical protein [Bacteroidota bacterium]
DDAHAALAKLLEDLVVGNNFSDHGRPSRVSTTPATRGTNGTRAKYGRGRRESNSGWGLDGSIIWAREEAKKTRSQVTHNSVV